MTATRFLIHDMTGEAWPKVTLPQIALAGRSNVGKSSLLNSLVGVRGMARTSRTPGRTRGIVIFAVDERYAIADLPGYGYAKVSKEERASWRLIVEGYLSGCRHLRKVYLLVDARRGPEDEEEGLARYLSSIGVEHRFIATKSDKLTTSEKVRLRRDLDEDSDPSSPLMVSSTTGEGIGALRADITRAVAR